MTLGTYCVLSEGTTATLSALSLSSRFIVSASRIGCSDVSRVACWLHRVTIQVQVAAASCPKDVGNTLLRNVEIFEHRTIKRPKRRPAVCATCRDHTWINQQFPTQLQPASVLATVCKPNLPLVFRTVVLFVRCWHYWRWPSCVSHSYLSKSEGSHIAILYSICVQLYSYIATLYSTLYSYIAT